MEETDPISLKGARGDGPKGKKRGPAGPAAVLPAVNAFNAERQQLEMEQAAALLQQLQLQQMQKMAMSMQGSGPLPFMGQSRSAGPLPLAPVRSGLGASMSKTYAPSDSSTISGSEAEFLARQIHSADSSQIASIGRVIASSAPPQAVSSPHFHGDRPSPQASHGHRHPQQSFHREEPQLPSPLSPSLSTVSAGSLTLQDLQGKVSDALASKIATFEAKVAQLSANLKRREEELEKKDEKLRNLMNEMDALKKNRATELERLHSQHESEVIRLREQFAKEKAAIALAVHNRVDSPTKKGAAKGWDGLQSPFDRDGTTPLQSSSSVAYEANARLLEQIETLRREQRRQIEAFAEER